MTEPTMATLTQRLDRLERESRRWKLAGCLGVPGLAAVVLMGQAMPGKLAKVVDDGRHLRALGPRGEQGGCRSAGRCDRPQSPRNQARVKSWIARKGDDVNG